MLSLMAAFPMLTNAAKKIADYTIWGFVRDENGDLLAHADVYTVDKIHHVFTDEQGRYTMIVQRDSLTLVYSYVGYVPQKMKFQRHANVKLSYRYDVKLEIDNTELEDVEIRGEALQLTTAEKVDISTINITPSVTGGIEGLLKTFQGVSSTNELSSQYSVRGGSYDENSV
ncbi:MAG: carboxypeptidase-like regulatory domain-containing protein, partial [Paludibacteraceae bacterium]|nr:carboxypeptidase-like regulatory domain-containing protein [Paludibacteraceae bacterium]